MADKFKTPEMDWTSAGNMHKRFKLFKQKCDLIFDGPLADKPEAYKVRMLLLWINDKGLEIYNTSVWTEEGDNMKLARVLEKLEAYTKPQSNQILVRFQLRSLKQGDTSLEEFVTKARSLIDESGYAATAVDETLRDTLVFGLKSDKVRKDAIALGNMLTFKQIYDLAKTEESTKAQMEIITTNNTTNDLHAMKRQPAYRKSNNKSVFQRHSKPGMKDENKSIADRCQKCGGRHYRYDDCPAAGVRCNHCGRIGHFKRVCRIMQRERHKLHEVVDKFDSYYIDDGGSSEDETGNIGCISSNKLHRQHSIVNGMISQSGSVPVKEKIFVRVKLNDKFNVKLKIDTGADICTITRDDLRRLDIKLHVKDNSCILHKYGGGRIKTFGQAKIKITFNGKSMWINFIIVEGNGSPSVLGCKQSQELGVITVNIHDIESGKRKKGIRVIQKILVKKLLRKEFSRKLKDNAQPVVHPPRTVPVHILPLYKKELENMIANDVVEQVTQPTDWVNSIVCNVTKTSDGKQKDIFQKKLDDIFQNIPNVTGIADDIIVYGETPEEHDKSFIKMLNECRKNNIGLNSEKLQFKQRKVEFYGHSLSDKGIQPSEDKLRVIKNIKSPENAKELLPILGMITYLNRFSTKIAELSAPLRRLTKKSVQFVWESEHQHGLDRIKVELCAVRILSYYDPNPNTTTILQCDASLKGLGAWIRQIDCNGEENIVAMGSRALTDAESRYSNIERECLAVAYGLEKFEYYLYGRHVIVETDHSPLEQIFKKNIVDAPARLQRLLLKCLKFDVTIKYKQGIKIPVADALSRVIENEKEKNSEQYKIHFMASEAPPINLEVIKQATDEDMVCNKLKKIIYKGWPDQRKQCPQELWDYWNFRCDLVLENGLIVKGNRIVVPSKLRSQV
ncbi:uncharacterized protein LOC144427401 [Styela clava]